MHNASMTKNKSGFGWVFWAGIVLGMLDIGFYVLLVGMGTWMEQWNAEWSLTPTMRQTLSLRIWTFLLCGAFLAMLAMCWGMIRKAKGHLLPWLGVAILVVAWPLRWVTPDMAFNSIVRPDAVHFGAAAQQLVMHGRLSVPTLNALLPARTLPGPSFLFALTQWICPEHIGYGIWTVWLCAGAMIALAFAWGRRMSGRAGGWWAALLIALSPSLGWYSRQLMSEIPWGLLVLGSAGLLASASERPGRALLAGILAGLGMLIKSSHLLMVLGMTGALAWMSCRGVRVQWKTWAGWLIGVTIGLAPAFIYNKLVLGAWGATAYHVYWPGWANATTALNFRYLFSPPLIDPVFGMGNIPYYLFALLGLDPRPERMILFPGLLVALVVLFVAARRAARKTAPEFVTANSPAESPAPADVVFARLFQAMAVGAGGLYLLGCLLYSFQAPRFLLPVVPLIFVALSQPLARATRQLHLAERAWLPPLAAMVLACMLSLGAAIVVVETGHPPRLSEQKVFAELARCTTPYDLLVSDEDPLLLTAALPTDTLRILPLLLPGELWFPEDPAALYREKHVAVEPFAGTVPLVRRALESGQSVVAYFRRTKARPEAWAEFNRAFLLEPIDGTALPFPLYTVTPRPPFLLGAVPPPGSTAANRSSPVHPVRVNPFELAPCEVANDDYAAFLNDLLAAGEATAQRTEPGFSIVWKSTGTPLLDADIRSPDAGLRLTPPSTITVVPGMERLPVNYVTWLGAALYCNALSRAQGISPAYALSTNNEADASSPLHRIPDSLGWRLPAEAEWEQAATWNGLHKRLYVWGDIWDPAQANLAQSPHPNRYLPQAPRLLRVDAPPPWAPTTDSSTTSSRLYHLAGNVWEWCDDTYADYTDNPSAPPPPPAPDGSKTLRGASFRTMQESAWAAFRGIALPQTATDDIGFRPARSLP